jgi:hypothetical protein
MSRPRKRLPSGAETLARRSKPNSGRSIGPDDDWCDTGATLSNMPTQHRRHAITETPPVKAALDELRDELGDARIEFGELVILGAHQKVAQLRAERDDTASKRRQLASRIRRRDVPVDRAAADEVRRAGWARP